jgi:hypothetical protein
MYTKLGVKKIGDQIHEHCISSSIKAKWKMHRPAPKNRHDNCTEIKKKAP